MHRDGKIFRQTYSKGKPHLGGRDLWAAARTAERSSPSSPTPRSSPIPPSTKYEILANRLRELAFLNKGIRLNLYDKRRDEEGNTHEDHFWFGGGPQGVR